MRVLIDDPEDVQAAPVMHRHELLPQLLNLLHCLYLLHYDPEHSIFDVVLFHLSLLPILVILHTLRVIRPVCVGPGCHHQLEARNVFMKKNNLLYKGETVVLILVEGGDEHEAFGFAHYHVVVLEEQEEVQGRQVVLVVAVQEFEGV